MPCITDMQQTTNDLIEAYIVHLLGKAEAEAYQSDSDLASSDEEMMGFLPADSSPGLSLLPLSESDSESGLDPVGDGIIASLEELYSTRYIDECRHIPKTTENLRLLLDDHRISRPEIFHSYLRVTPACFDDLIKSIKDHHVFHSNSNKPQMPIERQVAIALYRFGHYGNAASTMKVALWAGVSYGFIRNVTMRVMAALCDPRF
ncbi:hypothetical protein C0992_009941 [Termitomyces sp. T32_za158]|nr:hypothetical protein C0992_009941 [Termitomyces sp. T32_za158]